MNTIAQSNPTRPAADSRPALSCTIEPHVHGPMMKIHGAACAITRMLLTAFLAVCVFGSTLLRAGPTDEQVERAVVKVLGALILHSKIAPEPDDDFGASLGRTLAKAGRDALIDSVLEDLMAENRKVERNAVKALVILALDGKLDPNRDRILAALRTFNPEMANGVEVTEFLIQLGKAIQESKK